MIEKKCDSMQTQSHSLTSGPIWKGMLMFALPVLLGNVFQQFYNAFDSWVVGQFIGDTALAAVSSSSSLIFMMIGFFNGLAMGAGVVIARYFGAQDHAAMEKTIHTNVAFGLITGISLSVFGVIFTPTILRWMGTPSEVLPQSIAYFRYYSIGAVFVVLYNIMVGILHAVGDSRHPLYYLIFSTGVNVVLDLLFVAVLHMGVGSAAMATTISQGISALLCFLHLLQVQAPYRMEPAKIRIHRQNLQEILRYGIPAGVQNSVIAIANVVVQSNINSFGAAAMAGCGAHSKLEGFVFLPITCFTQAIATFVSQNLGAGQHDRVKKGAVFGIVCSMTMAELIGIFSYFFAPNLIMIFNDSPDVVDFGSRHMRTVCLFYFMLAFTHCVAAIMRGSGRTGIPMYTFLICWCLIRVSYITVAVRFINQLETVSWAYPITWTCSSVVFLYYLFKGDWIHTFAGEEAPVSLS